jgi:CRISPR/Cas system-associated protein Cas5 (RAMP superfamily)
MKFSAIYKPTALFSLRDSSSTSSGAKSLLLPSPYAIKMAFLSQAISLGGENFGKDKKSFEIIRDANIAYHITGSFCVNNCFVKIQKQREKEPFKATVSFREYVHLNDKIEIIFTVHENLYSENIRFLKQYLFRINYFGKRGCFFQFVKYCDNPSEPNVYFFDDKKLSPGLLQEYDDFEHDLTFDKVNSYSNATTNRCKHLLILPLKRGNSSKSYTIYKSL